MTAPLFAGQTARHRPVVVVAAIAVGVLGLAVAAVLAFGGGAAGGAGGESAVRAIGPTQTSELRAGRGAMSLQVVAEVPPGPAEPLVAVPAGAPFGVRVTMPPGVSEPARMLVRRLGVDHLARAHAHGGGEGTTAHGAHGGPPLVHRGAWLSLTAAGTLARPAVIEEPGGYLLEVTTADGSRAAFALTVSSSPS